MNENLSPETLKLLESRQHYTYSHIPPYKKGSCGVYIIKFPNGKRYVGSSNHVFTRLKYHLLALESQYSGDTQWYQVAAKENHITGKIAPPPDPRDKRDKAGRRMGKRIKKEELNEYCEKYKEWEQQKRDNRESVVKSLLINIFYCDDYRDFEKSILKSIPIEERKFWYNSIF